MAMYEHLGIQYQWQKFRFEFWKHEDRDSQHHVPYFVHASDNHECPPPRPRGKGVVAHTTDVIFVSLCFFWFMACCHIVHPGANETFDAYLRRIWMPRAFISRFLLPLVSAIATCSHQEILGFPASDVVLYRRLIRGEKQYIVTGGVRGVQDALTVGLDARFGMRVVRLEPVTAGVELLSEKFQESGQCTRELEVFDQVVTAVPPNIVAEIFEPARSQLCRIPIRRLETFVHRPSINRWPIKSKHGADQILLRTSDLAGGWTEATHMRSDGIAVTSCPILPSPAAGEILTKSTFTRTLRTPQSRQIVASILHGDEPHDAVARYDSKRWRNGDRGTWVVGAWCFDGMVLLEGAVASATHVAKAFGVEIPWEP